MGACVRLRYLYGEIRNKRGDFVLATEENKPIDKSAIDAFINEESAEHVDEVVRKYEAE